MPHKFSNHHIPIPEHYLAEDAHVSEPWGTAQGSAMGGAARNPRRVGKWEHSWEPGRV